MIQAASWQRDSLNSAIPLEASDIVIAATDGLFDALHIFGPRGLETRRFIRVKYFNDQCDPGFLAEHLLMMARKNVFACRGKAPQDMDTPFMLEAIRRGEKDKFQKMPEDDIAVVVSYALSAPDLRPK